MIHVDIMLIVLFIIVLIFSSLNRDAIDNSFMEIGGLFEQEIKRPHSMFDINTYEDSHEWGN
jgi:hypothetical protein